MGGPYLVIYVTPTEEELFKRYNPDLQRRSLENRQARQQDFDTFTSRLKEYSKSDKPSPLPPYPLSLMTSRTITVERRTQVFHWREILTVL